jgi:hypothetical protein
MGLVGQRGKGNWDLTMVTTLLLVLDLPCIEAYSCRCSNGTLIIVVLLLYYQPYQILKNNHYLRNKIFNFTIWL